MMKLNLSKSILGLIVPRGVHTSRSAYVRSSQQQMIGWQQAAQNLDPKQLDFYRNEKIIMVDEKDKIIGPISKGDAHVIDQVKRGIYHRALSLLIFDDNDRFLLTQRASSKITFPDYYTNACCSHPLYEPNELEQSDDAIGVKRATIRRANYELGTKMDDIRLDDLKYVNRIAYRALSDGGQWGEAEIDYIFVMRKNLSLNVNAEEVQSFRYVTRDEMRDLLENHRKYNIKITPWVRLLARELLFSYWDNLDQLEKIAKPEAIVYEDEFLMDKNMSHNQ